MSVPTRLNHVAYQTDDMAETHRFYTEVLGFDFVGAVRESGRTASNGDVMPEFLHTFYAMPSGECIAFFETADTPERRDDGWPWWTRHLALELGSVAEVDAYAERVRGRGTEVRGPVDHDGLWYSVYCFDPSGVHLEFTHQTRPLNARDRAEGETHLASWLADRAAGRIGGTP